MSKHTPGKWALESIYNVHKIVRHDLDGDTHIATIHPIDYEGQIDEYGPEADANARLIAAAPELLEALIHARDFVVQYAKHTNRNAELDLAIVDAAINKATGN